MIAGAIAKYIDESGIKQVFLSEKTGLTKHCISMALKGQRKLSIDEYEKICIVLNVPYEYFFNQCKKTA
jgi:transcriptional regulator with XRE-family HTH domain